MTSRKRSAEGDLLFLRDRMNRVFEESLRDSGATRFPGQFVPHVDIYEDDATLTIKIELPGVRRDDIALDITDGVLTISGRKPFEHEEAAETFHVVERQYGFFRRSFNLPGTLGSEGVEALYHAGVLEIVLQKSPETVVRRIPIVREGE